MGTGPESGATVCNGTISRAGAASGSGRRTARACRAVIRLRPHRNLAAALTRDGVATPTWLTTPDALRAGAIIAALAEGR